MEGFILNRVFIYLKEMFPPLKYIPSALGIFFVYFLSLSRLEGIQQITVTWTVITGALSTIFFLIFLSALSIKEQ